MYSDFTHLTRPEVRTHDTCTVIFTHLTRPEVRTHGTCTVIFTHLTRPEVRTHGTCTVILPISLDQKYVLMVHVP